MTIKRFNAILQKSVSEGRWTFIDIPFDTIKLFGKKGRIPVKGTIDGVKFRSSLLPHGNGTHYLIINIPIRNSISKKSGDIVKIVLQHDTEIRTVEVPEAFLNALKYCPDAKNAFNKYPYSHKKEIVDWIMDAKREETKIKRIEKAIQVLSQKNK
jgi:hypothetical protein